MVSNVKCNSYWGHSALLVLFLFIFEVGFVADSLLKNIFECRTLTFILEFLLLWYYFLNTSSNTVQLYLLSLLYLIVKKYTESQCVDKLIKNFLALMQEMFAFIVKLHFQCNKEISVLSWYVLESFCIKQRATQHHCMSFKSWFFRFRLCMRVLCLGTSR